jgi:hypothetical protein
MHHYLVWLGAPLGSGPSALKHSFFLGIILLAFFILAVGYVFAKLRFAAVSGISFAWILIAGFILSTGLAVSVGRSGFGVEQALASRYQTFSTVFLPLIFPVLLLCGNIAGNRLRDENRICCTAVLGFITGAGFILFAHSSIYAWADSKSYGDVRRRADLAVEFESVIPDNPQLSLAYPVPEKILWVCSQLAPHHLPYVTDPAKAIAQLTRATTPFGNGANGFLDRVQDVGGGQLIVSGWAIVPQKTPADGVLVVWKGDDGRVKPVSVVPVNVQRPDVATALATKGALWSGFDSVISKANFPGPGIITAWAIDSTHYSAYQLGAVNPTHVSGR